MQISGVIFISGVAVGNSPIFGLSEAEFVEVVNKVAANHRQKTFDLFGPQDIEQEVWIISLKAAPAFKMPRARTKSVSKAVEHWLNRVVSTRLTNLYRDRFAIKQKELKKDKSPADRQFRQKLASAGSMDLHAYGVADPTQTSGLDRMVEAEEMDSLLAKLSPAGSEIFDAISAGESLPSYYRTRVIAELRNIVASGHGGHSCHNL